MSNFKQMLQHAADTFTNDDEVENVLVIVTKRAVEDKIEQHTFTNILCPVGHIVASINEALNQIVEEKKRRLGLQQQEL